MDRQSSVLELRCSGLTDLRRGAGEAVDGEEGGLIVKAVIPL